MSSALLGAGLLWYASYGSNLSRARFDCYLRGGRPPGAHRTYPGCRDTTAPADDRSFVAAGTMHFAWESPTWGGGIAFYDPEIPGRTLCRAYLITRSQFADIAAQEMRRTPSGDLELADLFAAGRLVLGPGRYEALHVVGDIEDRPVITFTHSEATDPLVANAPSAAYLRMLVDGLATSHGLQAGQIGEYLSGCPGIGWRPEELAELISGHTRFRSPASAPPGSSLPS